MKAVRVHAYGGPEVLTYEEVPEPVPGTGEILVRVRAAGVNPGEAKIRQGLFAPDHALPLILGFDFSGVVESLGPGATGFTPGEAVYSYSDSTRDGANAEFVAVRAAEVAPKPATLDFVEAASVPLAGLTAWQALFDVAGLSPGQTILVHGGGGAVGSFAVQFARWKGARVIATASGGDISYVREIGAARVVDYKNERFEDVAHGVDVVLDTVGGETQQRSWQTLRPGGTLVTTPRPLAPGEAEAHGGVRGTFVNSHPDSGQLRQIAALIDAGEVRTRVGLVLPLAEARRAHELLQQGGTPGKVVLRVA